LGGQKNLQVITNNMGAFQETQGLDLELIMIGGTYREQSNSLVGPLTMLGLQQVYGSKCFIGVDGISRKYGLTTPILQLAEAVRTMIERTRGQVIVVADHSKLGVVANFMIAPSRKWMSGRRQRL
jgi:DeoR family fructose operon transcriptional repressor